MPDRFTSRRLIEAYKGRTPHPDNHLTPTEPNGTYSLTLKPDYEAEYWADLEAFVEFAIDQALAGKLESL